MYYNENGLEGVEVLDFGVSAGTNLKNFNGSYTLGNDVNGKYLKVFVFDSLYNIVPLTNSKLIQ